MAIFRFFDLPRELRDQIYTHLVIPILEITPRNKDDVFDSTHQYTLEAPRLPLLLVAKQFAFEYADLLPKQNQRKLLIIGDTSDDFTCFPKNKFPFANYITDITIYIHVQCYCDHMSDSERQEFFTETGTECDGVDQLEFYWEKIPETLLQYRQLENLHLKLGLWGAEDKPVEWPLKSHTYQFTKVLDVLIHCRGLKTFEIVRCSSSDDYWHYVRESVWRWENKKTGKAEYRLGRGSHQLSTFGKYEDGYWYGGTGTKTKAAWGGVEFNAWARLGPGAEPPVVGGSLSR